MPYQNYYKLKDKHAKLNKIRIKSGSQTCWSALAAALDVQKPEEDQTQGSFFAFGTSLGLFWKLIAIQRP